MKKILAILVLTGIVTPSLQVISCSLNLKQDLPEIYPISLVAGKQVKDLKDVVYEKISKVSGINKDIIKADSNLKITKKGETLVNGTALVAGDYTIKIIASPKDQYFIGQRTINVIIYKQYLPTFKPMTFDKPISQGQAKGFLQTRIITVTGLTENDINNANIKYEFYKCANNDYDNWTEITDPTENLRSGNKNYVKYKVENKNDQYFNLSEKKFYIRINKMNLTTADLTIEPFDANEKTGKDLMNKVYEKVKKLSGYWAFQLHDNFFKGEKTIIKDEKDKIVGEEEPLTPQTYTITLIAPDNNSPYNWAFEGEKTITVTLT